MAPRKPTSRPARKPASTRSSSSAGPFLLGILFAAAVAAGAWWFLRHKEIRQPKREATCCTASTPAVPPSHPANLPPRESAFTPKPPFGTSEDVYEAGARLYARPVAFHGAPAQSCAYCHGSPSQPGAKNPAIIPPAQQFFTPSAHPGSPGQIFVRTKYGLRSSPAMPAYGRILTDRQIWQIALLLANANQPLPDPVNQLLDARPGRRTP